MKKEALVDYKKNWSSNLTYSSDEVLFPASVHDVQSIVKNPTYSHVKAYGSRHCFNTIADVGVDAEREHFKAVGQKKSAHICMEKLTKIWFNDRGF